MPSRETPRRSAAAVLLLLLMMCAIAVPTLSDRAVGSTDRSLDPHAAEYLELVARLGELNPDSVDFQPSRRTSELSTRAQTSVAIGKRATALAVHLRTTHSDNGPDARVVNLVAQLRALSTRVHQLIGRPQSLDEELAGLFALSVNQIPNPPHNVARDVLENLARRLPGDGSLSSRLFAYQRRFLVPRSRLHAVVIQSIAACRQQTLRFLALPPAEGMTVEYVADKPWSGYSFYLGDYKSLMQVNRTLPSTVGQVLNLACHEGYPGHHVYNTLREQGVVRTRGWQEATSLPLFSPEGFRAEAAASAAAAFAFTPDERLRLFRDKLFPLAGLDPHEAGDYVAISTLIDRLSVVAADVIRQYLGGKRSAEETARRLERETLMEHPEALVAYVDRYRGYTFAYTWGRDQLLAEWNAPDLPREEGWKLLDRHFRGE